MEDAIFRFHKTKKDDLIMAAASFLKALSIYIHLEMEMEKFVVWFWLMF